MTANQIQRASLKKITNNNNNFYVISMSIFYFYVSIIAQGTYDGAEYARISHTRYLHQALNDNVTATNKNWGKLFGQHLRC